MAGVGQSIGEHDINDASVQDVELGPDNGVDLSVDHGADLGEDNSLNPVADHGLDPALGHGLDPAVGHGLDPSIGHGLDPSIGHGLDPAIGHGLDPAISHDGLDPAISHDGLDPAISHDGLDPAISHDGLDPDVGHTLEDDVDQHLGHADHGLDHLVDQGLDHVTDNILEVDHKQDLDENQTVEDDLENDVEEVSESYEAHKSGSTEDIVAIGVEKKWPGWPGESVFRMLVPAQKVGSIIGRRGEFIKKIVEETRARIKILDGPPGTTERAVMVSAKEEPDSLHPPAMDGLLRVHRRIIDGFEGDSSHALSSGGAKISTRLLVPASQAGSLIGKQGGTVKSIQEASACIVRVLGSEELPIFALPEDRVVEVFGEPAGVHKALELIASHLRKFLVDRGVIPMFETPRQMVNHQMEHMPPHQPWGPSGGLPTGGGPGYGHNAPYMPPPRQHDSYYPPADLPPALEKPHQGISAYGREAPIGVHSSSTAQAAPSMITQVTQQMQIPLAYADAVIGSAGTNISYIRRASGATVTIQETRGVPGEMTVEISGTASQVQAAQQFIQNFMAEAAAASGQAQTGGSSDQGYNPYASHGSVYASPPSNPGHAGGYGSVYGSGYGGY